jgi:adenylate cyclase
MRSGASIHLNMEIEFKLSCSPESATSLSRHLTRLTGAGPQKLKLQNTYYDTPQQDLRAQGIALRIRQNGELRLQTVKCAGQVSGGLSSRPEWEYPYEGRFDFSPVSDETVRAQLEALLRLPGYRATLATNFSRHIWHWRPEAGTHIEVMLDRGRILAGGREEAICEVELELVEGPPHRLLDLAAQMGELVPLFPAPLSKAGRGSLLLNGAARHIGDATPAPQSTIEEVFVTLAQTCLDHISINLPANCRSFEAKNLHQVRVGMRRLRALLQLFRPILREGWCLKPIQDGARAHMQALAPARNLHVLIAEILTPAKAELASDTWQTLHKRLSDMADPAFDTARTHLLSQPFAYWLLHTSLALHAAPVRKKWRQRPWSDSADTLLASRLKDYAQHLRNRKASPEALHELRKAGKHLRYQLAVCAQDRDGKPLSRRLARLQDRLGQINDLHSAGEILNRQAASYSAAIAALGAAHRERHAALHKELPGQLHQMRRTLAQQRKGKR